MNDWTLLRENYLYFVIFWYVMFEKTKCVITYLIGQFHLFLIMNLCLSTEQ